MPLDLETILATAHQVRKYALNLIERAFQDDRDIAVVGSRFVARASQALQSVEMLSCAGYNGDALAVARTIFELDLDFAFICKTNPEEQLRRFLRFESVTDWRQAKATHELTHDVEPDVLAGFQTEFEAAVSEYGFAENGGGWTKTKGFERAKKTGRTRAYAAVYSECCDASHAGPATLRYADRNGEPTAGPLEPESTALGYGCIAMVWLMRELLEVCDYADLLAPLVAIANAEGRTPWLTL